MSNSIFQKISLSSILLLVFFLMVWFGLAFYQENNLSIIIKGFLLLIVIIYFLIDALMSNKRWYKFSIKLSIVFFLIIFTYLVIVGNAILIRHQPGGDYLSVHDNPIQMEEAIKYLLNGKNPYVENYFGTGLELWGGGNIILRSQALVENPALHHFVSLPFHLFFSTPFHVISNFFFGWHDQRFVYIFSFILTLFFLCKITKKNENKLLLLILIAFNPLFLSDFVIGINDIFVFSWILAAIYFLTKNRINLSLIFMALACTSKHMAWFILPFYFWYIYLKNRDPQLNIIKNTLRTFKKTLIFFILVLIIIVPFLIWDFNSFINDVYQYPAGVLDTSYPINGIGFSMMLWSTNLINSQTDYFPFWVIQISLCAPLVLYLMKIQKKNNSVSQIMANYGLLIFVFLFFSRFFNFNYIVFIAMVFITAYFMDSESLTDSRAKLN